MKLVTFNIRCDYGEDGENNFVFRKPLILEKLRREEPDWGWEIDDAYQKAVRESFSDPRFAGALTLLAYREGRVVGRILTPLWPQAILRAPYRPTWIGFAY